MTGPIALTVILVVSPIGLLVGQAILSRLLRATGADVAPQLVALGTILIGNGVVGFLAWGFCLGTSCSGRLEMLCGLIYTLLVYNALCFCYLNVLNASETSLHVHIIMTVLLEGNVRPENLAAKYGAKEMIASRIDRMIALGQISERDGRFVLDKGALLVTIGKGINVLRRTLRLPLSPP